MNFLHEDADLLVVDKPAGLNVAADDGLDSVLARIQRKIPDACLVHRIDQDTSGVLLIAKNDATKDLLQAQFKARRVIKEYLAILDGNLPRDYVRKVSYLARNPKNRRQMKSYDYPQPNRKYRLTVSEFFVQHRVHTRLNLVKVNISTGRTHQIRVHAQSLGVPVLGDKLYHRPTILPRAFAQNVRNTVAGVGRQMLHASFIAFVHPYTRAPVQFSIQPPADFAALWSTLRNIS